MTALLRTALMSSMSESELDLLDDYLFEPTAWDLAMAIWIGIDEDDDRAALDELADAMLVWAEGPELERLTDEALDRLWIDELEQWIREGLVRVAADKDKDWERAAAAALVEFDRAPRQAEVSREVVRHLAMQLGGTDHPVFFCLDCLAESMSDAEPRGRRELAARAAILARRNAAVPEVEIREALAGAPACSPSERLGTVERRLAVRSRLGRLGELGRDSMPTLAAELRAIAGEPLPERAVDDDVWEVTCAALLTDVARPELN
jgi:hypothetical protein